MYCIIYVYALSKCHFELQNYTTDYLEVGADPVQETVCVSYTNPTGTQSSSKILAPHTFARRAWDMKALVVRRRAVRYRWEQVSEGH